MSSSQLSKWLEGQLIHFGQLQVSHVSANLFGRTTDFGGAWAEGTLYGIADDGTAYQILYSFQGGAADGAVRQTARHFGLEDYYGAAGVRRHI